MITPNKHRTPSVIGIAVERLLVFGRLISETKKVADEDTFFTELTQTIIARQSTFVFFC